jgi:catechol 2,3-dioxygenase-like lactoylglutathione lyase family enzyme
MTLGAFSISLAVGDLAASRAFYATLGFAPIPGAGGEDWQMMRNGSCTLGLFQGMFERNMLTFNPGWSTETAPLEDFEDIRALQARFRAAGLEVLGEVDPESTGPASLTVIDPDGNPVFFDQHVEAPKPG